MLHILKKRGNRLHMWKINAVFTIKIISTFLNIRIQAVTSRILIKKNKIYIFYLKMKVMQYCETSILGFDFLKKMLF